MNSLDKEISYRLGSLYNHKAKITKAYDIYEITSNKIEVYRKQEKHSPTTQTVISGKGTGYQRLSIIMEALDASKKIKSIIMSYPGLDAMTSDACNGYAFGHARKKGDMQLGIISDHWLINKGLLCRARTPESRAVEWRTKEPVAVWRGNKSGIGQSAHDPNKIRRDIFCDHFENSSLINAKIAKWQHDDTHIPRDEMCAKYKYMIHLEGNDTGSDIYWILGNRNIIFMPEIYTWDTIWHMHLEPWKHFVPFRFHKSKETGEVKTDIEDKIKWCEKNEAKCEAIMDNANQLNDRMIDMSREHELLEQVFSIYNKNIIL